MTKINSIGILGLGRFGRSLAELMHDDFDIYGYDPDPSIQLDFINQTSLDKVLKQKTLIIAVPIRKFSEVIESISVKLKSTTVIDVCSVKLYPVEIMEDYLSEDIGIIASHPLFGPDSIDSNKHLKIMLNKVRDPYNVYDFWKQYFQRKSVEILEMTPDEHDKQAAFSQGITHFLGRSLQAANTNAQPLISTLGFEKLLDVKQQTCYDSIELFEDMQKFNPYTEVAINQLLTGIEEISTKFK
ncbi:MAG: prephenate dehydrogenase/arogenate dehydrogenase family protein [Gammaproteobacteria bacterium]|nr:prephenate dehydrogenase/arogenate dehydrogenase family protein [Gammaproteobacteria bacterium]